MEAETSTSGTPPYTNGSAVLNGAAAANGKAVNGSAAAAGALVANGSALANGKPLANGATTIALGDVDASAVLTIEDNIDACGAGQLEACATDR